jgi:uncharacterized protein with FMN-binding domain
VFFCRLSLCCRKERIQLKLSGKHRALFYFEALTVLVAIALVAIGSWIHTSGSEWIVFSGIALFLLAGVPSLRAIAGPWTTEDLLFDRKSSAKKISHGLVALSSAAILVVYAAGYNRTSSAADRLEAQGSLERHRSTAVAAETAPLLSAPLVQTAIPAEPDQPTRIVSAKPQPVQVTPSAVAVASAPLQENAATATETPAPQPEASQPEPVNVAAAVAPEPAPQPAAPVQVAEALQSKYVDGTYFAWGSCRHGSLQVKLIIESGKIASADIEQCRTRYSCSVIRSAPPQLISRQNPEALDNVSGATQSVDAYYYAVTDALKQAARPTK